MVSGDALRLPDAAGYEVRLLCVGSFDFPSGHAHPDEAVTVTVNSLLLRGHGVTLLIDAGAGPADVLHPGAGNLDEALSTAGVSSGDIDAAVLTHVDFDHAGGVLAGRWPDAVGAAFPLLFMSAVDFGVKRAVLPDEFDIGTRLIEVYQTAQRLQLVNNGHEFRPNLRLVSAPGHSPGHCVLLIGNELVFAADLVHTTAQVEHPEWDRTDDDRAVGLATRAWWFAHLAEAGTPVVLSHVSERGRIVPGPRWEALG